MSKNQLRKVVVFDLDETLGYFLEFSIFCDSLKLFNETNKGTNTKYTQEEFNELLDLYPEFIRPNILPILKYLKRKVEEGNCDAVMIYTNNTGPKEWAQHIKSYFESKIKFHLFVQVIGAFKVKGKRIEMCRTTYDKTVGDFIKCSKFPKDTQISFLDDVYYPDMNYDNVYYIKVKPYIHDLPFGDIIGRYLKSPFGEKIKDKPYFIDFMNKNMKEYEYAYVAKTQEEVDIDKIITKQIMIYLQDFFRNGPNGVKSINQTKSREKSSSKNKTRKQR